MDLLNKLCVKFNSHEYITRLARESMIYRKILASSFSVFFSSLLCFYEFGSHAPDGKIFLLL